MVRIKDIAQAAQVSTSTVSRILNFDDTLSVSIDTRNQVLKLAQDMGYQKKVRKSSVLKVPRRTIGIIQWYSMSEELEDPYYFAIRLSVEKACYDHNIQFVKYFKENIEEVGMTSLDGLICVGKFSLAQAAFFKTVTGNLVFVDGNPDGKHYFSVVTDFRKATEDAMEYLYQLGHRKIGYIGGKEYLGPEQTEYIDRRESTYHEFMMNHPDCLYKDSKLLVGHYTTTDGYELMKKSLERHDDYTAYLIASDSMAIGSVRAIYEYNPALLSTLSLLSYNDIPTAKFTNPPLTTMRVDTDGMGILAVQLFDQIYHGKFTKPFKLVLQADLIIRQSTRLIDTSK